MSETTRSHRHREWLRKKLRPNRAGDAQLATDQVSSAISHEASSSKHQESTTILTTLSNPANLSSLGLVATPEKSNSEQHTVLTRPASQIAECSNGFHLGNEVDPQIETQSLWNQAYDALKEQDEKLINEYESLARQKLADGVKDCQDFTKRQSCFEYMSARASERQETKGTIHIFGHAIPLQQSLKKIASTVSFAQDWISDAVQASPQASVAWSVVLLALPLLKKPSQVDQAIANGFIYVSVRLRYYIAMEDLFLPEPYTEDSFPAYAVLRDQVKALYQKILEFQIRNILRLEKNAAIIAASDVCKQEEWKEMLKEIKTLDDQISKASSQLANENIRIHLAKLRSEAGKYQNKLLEISEGQLGVQKETLQEIKRSNQRQLTDKEEKCLQSFYLMPYNETKDQVETLVGGTGRWFLDQEQYKNWLLQSAGYLFVTADPGCGKSVLAKFLIDRELQQRCPEASITYFFFKDQIQNKLSSAFCAILHQLLRGKRELIKHAVKQFEECGPDLKDNAGILFDILCNVINDPSAGPVILVFDAMDECDDQDRRDLFRKLKQTPEGEKLKVLFTSRPYANIQSNFEKESRSPSKWVHIPGEQESEVISREIDLVINHRLNKLKLDSETRDVLEKVVTKMKHRTYLWAYLIFNELEEEIKKNVEEMKQYLAYIPETVEAKYEQILGRNTTGVSERKQASEKKQAFKVLQIMLAATRPLSLRELQIALVVSTGTKSHADLKLMDDNSFQPRIRQWCGLMVQIHKGKVLFLHQTVREFLLSGKASNIVNEELPTKWGGSIHIQQAHTVLARSCIAYLHLAEFQPGLEEQGSGNNSDNNDNGIDNESRKQLNNSSTWYLDEEYSDSTRAQFPFLTYSAEQWNIHFEKGSCNEDNLVANAVALCKYTEGVFRTLYRAQDSNQWNWWRLQQSRTPEKLQVAACLRSTALVKILLRTDKLDLNKILEALLEAERNEDKTIGDMLLDYAMLLDRNDPLYAEMLVSAAFFGRQDLMIKFIEYGISTNSKNRQGETALYQAARRNHVETAATLLKHGADSNCISKYGDTPLHTAARENHVEMAATLLEHNADSNCVDEDGNTPLHTAARENHVEIAATLLKHNADSNCISKYGNTPLHTAAFKNHVEMAATLLEHNADSNCVDEDGNTPLHTAAPENHVEMAVTLLEHNADSNCVNKGGDTPLHTAALENHVEMAVTLLKHGADSNCVNKYGDTPLHIVALLNHVEMAVTLLEHNADSNCVNKDGNTPLHIVALKNHVEIAATLLKHNADSNCVNKGGDTPLHTAAFKNYVEMVAILLDNHKSNANAQNTKGSTALHFAAIRGCGEIARLLIQHDADPAIADGDDSTANDIATLKGHVSIAALLSARKVVKKRASLSDLWPLKPFWELKDNVVRRWYTPSTYNKTRRRLISRKPQEPRRHSFSGYTDHELGSIISADRKEDWKQIAI